MADLPQPSLDETIEFSVAGRRFAMSGAEVLAKAFRGELVPQDSNDEPASELLRRLQQEAPSPRAKRRRKSAA